MVAVGRDGDPAHEFHHEIRAAFVGDRRSFFAVSAGLECDVVGDPRIENLGDVRMVHHCKGLALRLETSDYGGRIHPKLDDLHRDTAADRDDLFSSENDTTTAFT